MPEPQPTPAGCQSRDVVTAFLWDGQRLLLARRSDRTSTFPGHWAAISGYLEGDDPRQWALTEIREECGIEPRHLTLHGAGEPLEARDDRWGSFRVHPLLFAVDNPADVRPDWEAAEFRWVNVEEFCSQQLQPMVPRLLDAFNAVRLPWNTERAIAENRRLAATWLRNDRSLGAGGLARAAGWEWAKLIRLAGERDFSTLRPQIRAALEELKEIRPVMAAPANLLADIAVDAERLQDAVAVLQVVQQKIEVSEEAQRQVARQAAERLAQYRTVITLSYSGTVLSALQLAGPRLSRVLVCEGRPLLEGRQLASELSATGLPVTLLTDAQAWTLMPEADCVLVGADAVLACHDVINKAGTALLALAARHCGKPVLVAADRLKWERKEGTVVVEETNRAGEVWPDAPAAIEIANRYFDRVPAQLITELISEDGWLAPSSRS